VRSRQKWIVAQVVEFLATHLMLQIFRAPRVRLVFRRIAPRLFTQRDAVCDTCLRKISLSQHQMDMGHVVDEQQVPTSETDSDLQVFMDQYEDWSMKDWFIFMKQAI
jgi:hypothetical protein